MYQSLTIAGNLGRDPEMRYTPSGQAVTSFSVAVDESYTDNGGQKVKRTTWFKVSTWGKQAEICNDYLHKGSKVLVEGRLTSDPATGGPRLWKKGDGEQAASYELNASTVRFLSGKEDAPAAEQSADVPF